MNNTGQLDQSLDLETILRVLRERWGLVVLLAIIGAAAAFGISSLQAKQYTATSSVVFQNSQLSQQASGVEVYNNSPSSDPTIMATNIELLNAPDIARMTASAVSRRLTRDDIVNSVTVSERGSSDVADIAARNGSATLAAAIANEYAENFVSSQSAAARASLTSALALVADQISVLSPTQRAGTDGQALLDRQESLKILASLQTGGVQLLNKAAVPTAPSTPKTKRNVILGLLAGLLAGIALAFVLNAVDRRLKTLEATQQAFGAPLLASVPRSTALASSGRASVGEVPEFEVFRLLRSYLRYFTVDREMKVLLVVSARRGEGKSTVARNLAIAAQELGSRALLVEADLRRPTVARAFGVTGPGLAQALVGGLQPLSVAHKIPLRAVAADSAADNALTVVTAGEIPPNPAELIESMAMSRFLELARHDFDLIVVDTPPLTIVSDAIPLVKQADGVLVVSRIGEATRDDAAMMRGTLGSLDAPVLGLVINGVTPRPGGYGYGYSPSTQTTSQTSVVSAVVEQQPTSVTKELEATEPAGSLTKGDPGGQSS
jgi:capsular exopolysaccharide synthesis family protein